MLTHWEHLLRVLSPLETPCGAAHWDTHSSSLAANTSVHFITTWFGKLEIPVAFHLASFSRLSLRGLCLMLLWEIEFESLEVTSISSSGIMAVHSGAIARVRTLKPAFCWQSTGGKLRTRTH